MNHCVKCHYQQNVPKHYTTVFTKLLKNSKCIELVGGWLWRMGGWEGLTLSGQQVKMSPDSWNYRKPRNRIISQLIKLSHLAPEYEVLQTIKICHFQSTPAKSKQMQFYHFEERRPCQQRVKVQVRKDAQTYKYSDSFYLDSHFPRTI